MGRQRQAHADGAQHAAVRKGRPRPAGKQGPGMEYAGVVAAGPAGAGAGPGDLAIVRGAQAARAPDRLWRRTWRRAARAVPGAPAMTAYIVRRLLYGVLVLLRSEEHTSELQSRENLVC